jgi:hypothetical protein
MTILKGLKRMKVTEWTYWEDKRFKSVDFLSAEDYALAENAVIEELKANNYKFSGRDHQWGYCPVIDNEYIFQVSMRKWGDIMRKAYDLPNEDELGYVLWAWGAPSNDKPVYPAMECWKCKMRTDTGNKLKQCYSSSESDSCEHFQPK